MQQRVAGLQSALKKYDSSKIKDRAQGAVELRQIFSNRENIDTFQETAARDGGAGWIAFFQCLFQVVVAEKKAYLKTNSTATTERRLADAVDLVRRMAEKTVVYLSRKPFMTLFTHMTALLVHGGRIFEPVAVDYAKALRTLLSYPPHLEHLDHRSWRKLMSICWAGVLGERIGLDEDFTEALEEADDSVGDSGNGRYTPSTYVFNEITALIPVLLSCANAPLIPRQLKHGEANEDPAVGMNILRKIHKFLSREPAVVPLEILRSLNIVLGELELNSWNEFGAEAHNLFPLLVRIWTSKNKGDLGVREHILIAIRTLLPFVAHPSFSGQGNKEAVTESMVQILDNVGKEAASRAAVKPLDLDTLRFLPTSAESAVRKPFELMGLAAGSGFEASSAVSWVAVELLADCCYHTYTTIAVPSSSSATAVTQYTQRARKRQRTESTLDRLLNLTLGGPKPTRLLACQAVIFFLDRHWQGIHVESKDTIRKRLLELLDDDLTELQSWAFVGLASMASIDDKSEEMLRRVPVTPAALASRRSHLQTAWERLWAHAVRKTSVTPVSRAACHAAEVVLRTGKVDLARCLRDIHSLLKNVDIQGPPAVSEAASSFFVACLEHVRADAGLYSANLEDKVLDWFGKAFAVDSGSRGRFALDHASPLNHLRLVSSICNYKSTDLQDSTEADTLPDCPTVNRVLYEARTSRIRAVILYGTMPPVPDVPTKPSVGTGTPMTEDIDSLGFLEGRSRKLCDVFRSALEATTLEWTQNERAQLVAAEKLRRAVDLVALVLLFQATIQSNGYRPEVSGCLSPAANLLRLIVPQIRSLSGQDVANQLLVWRGFAPLYSVAPHHFELWPILVKPDMESGIRRDILPISRYASYFAEDAEGTMPTDRLLSIVWTTEETSEALADVVELAKSSLQAVRPATSSGTTAFFHANDDDDFGPIVNADADAMPQSLEAKEAQRSTSALLKALVDLRLRGPLLATAEHRPTKDVALVNALITSEGSRFAQLGHVVCDAILEGSMRLTVDVVDFILSDISDRIMAYAFKRDPELLRFAITFLSRTLPVWLAAESGLVERAIELAKALVHFASAGNMASWQARLQLLVFIDEYLDYDPNHHTWQQMSDTEEADVVMGGVHDELGPLGYVLAAEADVDSRVRYRAVSSAATIHYLPDMSTSHKSETYATAVDSQSNFEYMWDHFATMLLLKLNTCIASAELRPTTIFHIYELAESNDHFLGQLQSGLEAVARRLGLDSLQTLYRAHAAQVVCSQLNAGSLPLAVPPALYGCPSRKAFAVLCLQAAGPSLLANSTSRNLDFFATLCETAAVPLDSARMRHLPAAASLAVVDAVGGLQDSNDESVTDEVAGDAIAALPPPDNGKLAALLTDKSEYIVTRLVATIDLANSNAEVAQLLQRSGPDVGDTFARLTLNDAEKLNERPSPTVLYPHASAHNVLQALSFFRRRFKKTSRRRLVFDALIRLFYAVNDSYLVNEQRRYLRALAILASIYSEDFRHAETLQLFLRNIIELLVLDDIGSVAQSLLEWGFDQLASAKHPPADLTSLMISLGAVYTQMQGNPRLSGVTARLDAWVASKATKWAASQVICDSLPAALTFWPKHWAEHFNLPRPRFEDVAKIAEQPRVQNPLALCRRLYATANEDAASLQNKDMFLSSTFWYVKKSLSTSQWTHDGAMAFLDLLHLANGEVHAPSLSAVTGLMGRTRLIDLGKMYSGKPEWAVRVSVLDKIMQQTASDNYQLRTTAFEVLQTAFPFIKTMYDKGLPSYLHNLLVYLVPTTLAPSAQDCKIEVLVDESLGWVYKSRSHQAWARELSLLLSALAAQEDEFYSCLQPLLTADGPAAVELLPFLVQAVLTSGVEDHPDVTAIRATVLSDYFAQVLQYPTASTQTVEAIIQIILHLRHFKPPYGSGELSYDHWLSIDPLVLSEAAGRCGAFASSLLFLEMANDRDEEPNANIQLSDARVQKVMYDIYSNVEDPDGFYGIHNTNVMDSLHRRLDHEGQPLRSLGYNLAGFEAADSAGSGPLVAALRNLHDLGFNNLAGSVAKSMKNASGTQPTSDPFFLELAWRMGDWDVPLPSDLANTSSGRFYAALRAVHRERDREAARAVVDLSIKNEMAHLQLIGVERMTEIQKSATNLLCLRDVARWISQPMQKAIDEGDFDGGLLSGFVGLDHAMDFTNAEKLSAARLSLIRSARARESKNLLGDLVSAQSEGLVKLEISSQLRLSELARKDGKLQAAVNAITAVRQLEDGMSTPSDATQDEFSRVLWDNGEHALAIQHVQSTINSGEAQKKHSQSRHAVLLGRVANWEASAKLKSAEEIRSTFRRSARLADDSTASAAERARIAFEFAMFTDRYYVALKKSPELERLKSFVNRKKTEYARIEKERSIRSATPQSRRQTMDKAQEELEEERQAKEALELELLRYLNYALRNYACALKYSDDFDDSITRMVSIWMDNDTNEVANSAFAFYLDAIPTHKFLPLGPQLAARLYRPKKPTAFNTLLNKLMRRIGQDHPYHILYQIITLAHGVPEPNAASSRSSAASSVEGREAAAAEIVSMIQSDRERPLAAGACKDMTVFANASVQWCYFAFAENEVPSGNKEGKVPSRSPLLGCRGLKIPIATVPPPVDVQMKYDNIPTLAAYRKTFKVAGGVHHPTIMRCVDTLGNEHVQLFKGQDEVRQDAVMQQVFEMTNRLLTRDRKTHQRNLHFRTYNVIPLAKQSGIIEFVGNTCAIGDWLKPAHTRYRQKVDLSPDIFRKNMQKLQHKDWTSPQLVTTWQEQMKSFKPVMRHFFAEKQREPLAWFTMRLNYARSVAVTSMVGHMVGLGDRHCSNILIDNGTGELVHIDFGIVFEEGRKLRIPEKIPFRLTNDIVDGLGISGVDGTFRQCSEHTLRVLRDSAPLILTVLEVFKHDPLYAWSGDEDKMRRAQGGGRVETSSGTDKAERILARIRQKLGHELSVAYSVNQLIQEARDPEHLAKIFIGWQSWL